MDSAEGRGGVAEVGVPPDERGDDHGASHGQEHDKGEDMRGDGHGHLSPPKTAKAARITRTPRERPAA